MEARDRLAAAFVAERLNADLAGTGLTKVEFRYDPGWTRTAGDDVICVCGGHEFPLDVEAVEPACAEAASRLQDDAMDELNRPWPELVTSGGEYLGVLTPAEPGPGVAVWQLKGEAFCAVGHLHRAVEAAGLRIR
jgi:hypothetical protein